jgi:hypothetical protein
MTTTIVEKLGATGRDGYGLSDEVDADMTLKLRQAGVITSALSEAATSWPCSTSTAAAPRFTSRAVTVSVTT